MWISCSRLQFVRRQGSKRRRRRQPKSHQRREKALPDSTMRKVGLMTRELQLCLRKDLLYFSILIVTISYLPLPCEAEHESHHIYASGKT
mmetsp:Transcript_17320/g.35975  ORF Transcript_17320/g.35975 Transcript_17320/m.35975 type:complete len:90 (+) Transcript_17320:418-687(+)